MDAKIIATLSETILAYARAQEDTLVPRVEFKILHTPTDVPDADDTWTIDVTLYDVYEAGSIRLRTLDSWNDSGATLSQATARLMANFRDSITKALARKQAEVEVIEAAVQKLSADDVPA